MHTAQTLTNLFACGCASKQLHSLHQTRFIRWSKKRLIWNVTSDLRFEGRCQVSSLKVITEILNFIHEWTGSHRANIRKNSSTSQWSHRVRSQAARFWMHWSLTTRDFWVETETKTETWAPETDLPNWRQRREPRVSETRPRRDLRLYRGLYMHGICTSHCVPKKETRMKKTSRF